MVKIEKIVLGGLLIASTLLYSCSNDVYPPSQKKAIECGEESAGGNDLRKHKDCLLREGHPAYEKLRPVKNGN